MFRPTGYFWGQFLKNDRKSRNFGLLFVLILTQKWVGLHFSETHLVTLVAIKMKVVGLWCFPVS
jgi:hypothetical protein